MRALFWGACFPTRLVLAFYAPNILRIPALVIALRWLFNPSEPRVGFFGRRAWWAAERPLHGALWLAYAATGRRTFLLADAGVGAVNFATRAP